MATLNDLEPSQRILVIAYVDLPFAQLDRALQALFVDRVRELVPAHLQIDALRAFWGLLLDQVRLHPPLIRPPRALREIKPMRAPAKQMPSAKEIALKADADETLMRRLRKNIRNILIRLRMKKRGRFAMLFRPIDGSRFSGFYRKIREPMDLGTIENRNDAGYYTTIELFEHDIALIRDNCRSYFGLKDQSGLVSRSTELVDKVRCFLPSI